MSEGINETLAVVQEGEDRGLVTNGHHMSGTSFTAQRYMRAFVHVPLMHIDAPDTALVICFGVGNTAHAASIHAELERIDVVDLSENVLRHAGYFARTNHDVLRDPRLQVFVNDGRHHLRLQPDATYDLITLEPPPITHAGVSALYSVEFYRLAKSRLKPGGIMTQWLPAWMTTRAASLAIIRAFVDAFPESVLLAGERSELILMGVNGDRLEIDPDRVLEKIETNPALRADLEKMRAKTPTELIGMFAASAETLRKATELSPAVSDDYPIMEYAMVSTFRWDPIPREIFSVDEIGPLVPALLRGRRAASGGARSGNLPSDHAGLLSK